MTSPGEGRPYQPQFDQTDVTMPAPSVYEFRDRASLARMLQPKTWGVTEATYSQVTSEMIEMAQPARFRPDLIDVKPFSTGAVSYPDQLARRDIWVAMEPSEYVGITRNVRALGTVAVQRSHAKRPDEMFDEPQRERGQRSALHVQESRQKVMEAYVGNVLLQREQLLKKFLTAAQYPGLSHFGRELTFLERMTSYRDILDSTLRAIGNQRQWDAHKENLARRATEWRILYDRTDNHHIGNFIDLTQLLFEHNGAKLAVFKSRIFDTKRDIEKRTAD